MNWPKPTNKSQKDQLRLSLFKIIIAFLNNKIALSSWPGAKWLWEVRLLACLCEGLRRGSKPADHTECWPLEKIETVTTGLLYKWVWYSEQWGVDCLLVRERLTVQCTTYMRQETVRWTCANMQTVIIFGLADYGISYPVDGNRSKDDLH